MFTYLCLLINLYTALVYHLDLWGPGRLDPAIIRRSGWPCRANSSTTDSTGAYGKRLSPLLKWNFDGLTSLISCSISLLTSECPRILEMSISSAWHSRLKWRWTGSVYTNPKTPLTLAATPKNFPLRPTSNSTNIFHSYRAGSFNLIVFIGIFLHIQIRTSQLGSTSLNNHSQRTASSVNVDTLFEVSIIICMRARSTALVLYSAMIYPIYTDFCCPFCFNYLLGLGQVGYQSFYMIRSLGCSHYQDGCYSWQDLWWEEKITWLT